jgi:hypothetical protein
MTHSIPCPVCQLDLSVRPCQSRKSGKRSLMFICPEDGRHFRGFIAHQDFLNQVLERLDSPEDPSS